MHQLQIVDHDHRQAGAALEPARARAQRRDGQRRRVVDVERQALELLRHDHHPLEVVVRQLAAADALGGNAGLLGQDAGGELLGRHLEREERDDVIPVGLGVLDRARGVERHVGRQRGLSHRWAAGEDQQVGRMQPAEQLVHVVEARRHAGELALAPERGVGGVDRGLERGAEGLQPGLDLAGRRQIVEPLLGGLDLGRALVVEIVLVGVVDDVLAERDQLAAQMQVVHRAAVVLGVDDRGDRAREPHQIGVTADLREIAVGLEILLERDRVGDLAAIDQPRDRLEDAAVDPRGEVRRLQEVGDALEGAVVVQDRAEQRHLGFVVVRWRPIEAGRFEARRLRRSERPHRGDGIHDPEPSRTRCAGLPRTGCESWG